MPEAKTRTVNISALQQESALERNRAGPFSRSQSQFLSSTNSPKILEKFAKMENKRFEDVSGSKRSEAWKYFLFCKRTEEGQCQVSSCFKLIKATGGSTKGLLDHLEAEHKIDARTGKIPPAKKSRLTSYFSAVTPPSKMSLETKVARLCALSRLSFKQLATDVDIREALEAQKYVLPQSWRQVKNLVFKEYDKIVEDVKGTLAKRKTEQLRFSITTDEYTSVRNHRYINVNCHVQGDFHSLGVPRAHGTMPAEKQIDLIEGRLSKYGLNYMNDVIAIVTDGASVMCKVGKELKKDFKIEHFICSAHTLHLVVCDTFYKASPKEGTNVVETENISLAQAVDEEIVIDNLEDDDDESGDFNVLKVDEESVKVELKSQYKDVIAKVRKAGKLFKKSPVKNDDNLQQFVFEERGKEMSLLLDVPTRWNSMHTMLKRFYELRKSVEHAMVDLNENFDFTTNDIATIKDIIDALNPIDLAVQKLCRRDATLVNAERVLEICLEALNKLNSDVASQLYEAFIERVTKRRNSEMIHLMEYLSNPKYFEERKLERCRDSFGTKVDENKVKTKGIMLIKRLFHAMDDFETNEESELNIEDDNPNDDDALTIEEKMNAVFNKTSTNSLSLSEKSPKDFAKLMKHEMSAYEQSGKRSENLENLYRAMCTIPPTSVESERAFSAVGLFATKLRSSLGDKTLDALLTLRCHFKKQEANKSYA